MSYGIREVKLFNAWVNEMKENEYNPFFIFRPGLKKGARTLETSLTYMYGVPFIRGNYELSKL